MINLDRSLPMVIGPTIDVDPPFEIGLVSSYGNPVSMHRIRRQLEGTIAWGLMQLAPPESGVFEEFFLREFAKEFALPMSFLTGKTQ